MGITEWSRVYSIPPIGEIVYSKAAPLRRGFFFARHQGSASSKAARQARPQAYIYNIKTNKAASKTTKVASFSRPDPINIISICLIYLLYFSAMSNNAQKLWRKYL